MGLFIPISTYAVVANDEPFVIVQPDGRDFVATQGGDEWLNWTAHEGHLILRADDGWWYYAILRDGRPVRSDAGVGRIAAPANAAKVSDVILMESNERPTPRHPREPRFSKRTPPNPEEPLLVILVEFSDISITTNPNGGLWAADILATNDDSVNGYFEEVSEGAFRFGVVSQ